MNSRTKQRILEKYHLIVQEFFILLHESVIMKNLNYPILSIQIGLQSIHRVFEYILCHTQNIDNAYFYAQKTYYYYLEYMEQIHESNLSSNLNHIDAVLFVYKKTIIEFEEKKDDSNSSSVTNIMTLQNEPSAIDKKDIVKLFQKIERIVNLLFFWNHPEFEFFFLRQMSELFFSRFLLKIDKVGDFVLSLVELIQEKLVEDVPTVKYVELLEEVILRVEQNLLADKTVKKKEKSTESTISIEIQLKKHTIFLEKYYMNPEGFLERFTQEKMGDFMNWIVG